MINDDNRVILLSLISILEMQIKNLQGRLVLEPTLEAAVTSFLVHSRFQLLPILPHHVYTLARLPQMIHRDPFDRLLVAQALSEEIPLLSVDSQIGHYPITLIQ